MHPHDYGLTKAAYSVNETLNILSIGRTSLYMLVKRGDLNPAKLGRKTLFTAVDIAAFLSKLQLANSPISTPKSGEVAPGAS
jgi:Helix-turn-helix domain